MKYQSLFILFLFVLKLSNGFSLSNLKEKINLLQNKKDVRPPDHIASRVDKKYKVTMPKGKFFLIQNNLSFIRDKYCRPMLCFLLTFPFFPCLFIYLCLFLSFFSLAYFYPFSFSSFLIYPFSETVNQLPTWRKFQRLTNWT